MSEIKEGDVVFLKSNPTFLMTVDSIPLSVKKEAHCVWLTKTGKREIGWFALCTLEKETKAKK